MGTVTFSFEFSSLDHCVAYNAKLHLIYLSFSLALYDANKTKLKQSDQLFLLMKEDPHEKRSFILVLVAAIMSLLLVSCNSTNHSKSTGSCKCKCKYHYPYHSDRYRNPGNNTYSWSIDTDTATPTPEADTCVGIPNNNNEEYVEQILLPGQSFLGDVEILVNNVWVRCMIMN